MNTYIASFAWLFLFALAPACADDASFAKWEKEIVAIEAKIESGASPQECVLFVGSSSIRKWNLKESFPDLLTSNHGFGGSQMADKDGYQIWSTALEPLLK